MKTIYRAISILIIICVFTSSFCVSASCNLRAVKCFALDEANVASTDSIDKDIAEQIKQHIQQCVCEYADRISMSQFNIKNTGENVQDLIELIYDEIPLGFCVKNYNCYVSNGYISHLEPIYIASKEECETMLAQTKAVAESLVVDINASSTLSDEEKALLLHDRIAAMCEYQLVLDGEYDEWCSRTMYGVFVKRTAVCVGYAEAYHYLLDLVGIKSRAYRSDIMNHVWNIVTINEKEYHVDITWDDTIWDETSWDVIGEISHDCFLVSSEKLYDSHPCSDYDTAPQDTYFDNYYWRTSTTPAQLIKDKLYYFDNDSKQLVCVSDNKSLLTVNDYWAASAISHWQGNYTRLSSDGRSLYYSTSNGIYKYFIETDTSLLIHSPELDLNAYYSIYGFIIDNGYLVYDINNSPNFVNKTMSRIRVPLETEEAKVSFISSNGCSSSQVLTVEIGGDIIGYYWGTNEDYKDNELFALNADRIELNILSEGTYFFTPLEGFGGSLNTVSVTYHKTTFDANGGVVAPDHIISIDESPLNLPEPTMKGYRFCGWYTAKNGGELVTEQLSTESIKLYARWEIVGKQGDINDDGYINTLDASTILRYDAALISADERLLKFGDMNNDGSIDHLDACIILKIDAGLIKQ